MVVLRIGVLVPAAFALLGLSCSVDGLVSGSGGDSNGDGSGGSGGGNSDGPSLATACERVDLLISVDGSESMEEELRAMRDEIFPAFAQRLPSISEGLEDFRVATIDACPSPANFHTRGVGRECQFNGGQSWIESESPSMQSEFECVGDIYLSDVACSGDNDDEQPATTASVALRANSGNVGFLRDDALLVVVAITDEDEQPTSGAGGAQDVYERLVAIKGGDVRRMVFLGIGGGRQCSGVYGFADRADMLRQVTARFEASDRGVWWDLCDGRLEDGLEQAFAVIETACNELPPEGDNFPPGDGGPGDSCTHEGDCAPRLDCEDGVCTPDGDGGPGDDCTRQSDCSSGFDCVGGECTDEGDGDGGPGDACTGEDDCRAELDCTGGVCTPDGDNDDGGPGDSCTLERDCDAGLDCSGGVCNPDGPGGPGDQCTAQDDCDPGLDCGGGFCTPEVDPGGGGDGCVDIEQLGCNGGGGGGGGGGDGGGGGSGDGGGECANDADCPAGEFCSTEGVCLPWVQ